MVLVDSHGISRVPRYSGTCPASQSTVVYRAVTVSGRSFQIVRDRKSTRLNSSHTEIYTLSLHDALPISWDFTCPAVLRNLSSEPIDCRLPGCHRLWPIVPDRSTSRLVYHSPALRPNRPYNPGVQAPRFGLFRVRSPLLAESLLFSVPAGTEMVHFPALSSHRLCIQRWILRD